VDEELLETLMSLGDFLAFKDRMLAAKHAASGAGLDLSLSGAPFRG
jgi:hypothetical protein